MINRPTVRLDDAIFASACGLSSLIDIDWDGTIPPNLEHLGASGRRSPRVDA